jgi:outer membrane protein assembly factor BamB
MTNMQTDNPKPLRLWPGVAIVVVQLAAWFGLPILDPDLVIYAVAAGFAGGLALIVWWLFFSRALWFDRIGAIVVMVVAMAATWSFLDVSMATGAMGAIFPMLALPGLCLAFVLWAVASPHMPVRLRRPTMVVAIALACAVWTLFRTGGFTGSFDNDLAWRWTPTAEQRLLTQGEEPLDPVRPVTAIARTATPSAAVTEPSVPADAAPVAAPADEPLEPARDVTMPVLDWPGFRGRDRDSVVRRVRIGTDWAGSPPIQLWRRPIGPGWSSFAVHGDLLYTQEQRGDEEIVAAYRVSTGAPVWRHRDAARFWESNGGPGPRATPTIDGGRIYSFGATGMLNVLDAVDGRLVWSRNVATDKGIPLPDWGFSSSPLLIDDLVVVAAAGTLVAYDRATGTPRWAGEDGGAGYSSPHALTVGGVPQILLLAGGGITSVDASTGTRLWGLSVTSSAMAAPIVQPALTADGEVLISSGDTSGISRVAVARGEGGWTVEERWRSTGLKPYFNDFVVHRGHAFGFDGSILACIDLADGSRTWKGGRYGSGQLVLLADQDLLLVVSEQGELALVAASTDAFTELARIPGIEGKTWNHPVVVGDILLVRNGEEMAAFRLPVASR